MRIGNYIIEWVDDKCLHVTEVNGEYQQTREIHVDNMEKVLATIFATSRII
jgi:hypothetical protein